MGTKRNAKSITVNTTANNAVNTTANSIAVENTTNNAVENTVENVVLKGRHIVGVRKDTYNNNNRYHIELDGEPFESYNKDGEAIETNTFSINIFTLAKQIAGQHEVFNTVFAMAQAANYRDKMINPQIVAMCFIGAEIDIERVHKDADDLRNSGIDNDTYGKDTWLTGVTRIKPNMSAFATQAVMQLAFNPDTLTVSNGNSSSQSLEELFNQTFK